MKKTNVSRAILSSDLAVLILLALLWVIVFLPINTRYGFHRDELAFIDNAKHLDWGFVEYPPLTPAIARAALALFGPSLVGVRLFASLAMGAVFVLVGLMARELGGSRRAQILAAFAAVSAPIALSHANFFSYETFDYLWWVLIAYFVVRLIKTGDPRWWLGIGAAIGLGMMTKYTMIFGVAGLAAGVLFTPARRYLKSPWLYAGAGLALLIFLPNMFWQVRHNFISLNFLTGIHARDVQIGRTSTLDFLLSQLYICASGAAIFLWIGGLRFALFSPAGKPYRALGWMYCVPLAIFLILQGRFYYLAPAYPALIALGTVALSTDFGSGLNGLKTRQSSRSNQSGNSRGRVSPPNEGVQPTGSGGETQPLHGDPQMSGPVDPAGTGPVAARTNAGQGEQGVTRPAPYKILSALTSLPVLLLLVGLFNAAVTLPLAPIGSGWFAFATSLNPELKEQIGWPELTREVARIYAALPESERAQTGIVTGNYGEAGAVNLYGPASGLPGAISGVNTFWLRGYGNPPPRQVIVLGIPRQYMGQYFASCELAGHTPNPYNVVNEETRDHPGIYLCRNLKVDWQEFWKDFHWFG